VPASGDAAQAPAGPDPTAARCKIVGLGASAGGLQAYEQFFLNMPANSGLAFVLVQHLDPSHASILSDIIQRDTAMPVVEAADQMPIEPNHVYVIPPNRDMSVFHEKLQLSPPAEPRGRRMPVDTFLRSLAEDLGEDAIGVILSGNGTDGMLGARAIFCSGGLCFAQDPASAQFDGMPRSVIEAGYVHQALPADQLPKALISSVLKHTGREAKPSAGLNTAGLNRILMILRSATGHDFSQYKKSTITRRIERRMAQHNIDDASVYARFVKENRSEVQALFKELLINVTSFFRDPEVFKVLAQDILPELLNDKPEEQVLRIWIAGCASGEEAYSVAMLLREVADTGHHNLRVQLYSTDLDDEAIATARAALYPPNIAQDVSPERLKRFFIKEDKGYRIKKEIREMVVFATQSVIKDPPFTRLDLLVCRNVLIYLEPELQDRLIPTFHYALKPGGILLLSPSESVGNHTDLFKPVNRKWKFYRAIGTTASTRKMLVDGLSWPPEQASAALPEAGPRAKEPPIAEVAKSLLVLSFAPAAVVTDLQGNILFVHGETGKYLRPAPGQASLNVVEMARDGLQQDLREAMRLATAEGLPTLNLPLSLVSDGVALGLNLSVRPMPDTHDTRGMLLISFQERPDTVPPESTRKPRGKASADALRIEALARELAQAKASMTSMREEQQTSGEELKSTNEELQSTNEELQSTNEELETSKEELQSVNEELITVNAELQSRIEQMSGMQDDMKNLLESIRIGTIFLDRQLRIRRFTRDAAKVYRLAGTDIGRPLADFRSELKGEDLLDEAQTVLDTLVPMEREVCTTGGTWYLARIQPYQTVDNMIDGVVLTFSDVTERVQALAVRKARGLADAIVDAVPNPIVVLDSALNVLSANQAYYRAFASEPGNTVGQAFYALSDKLWDCPALHELLEVVLPKERNFQGRVIAPNPAAKLGSGVQGHHAARISAHLVQDEEDHGGMLVLSIEPIDADPA